MTSVSLSIAFLPRLWLPLGFDRLRKRASLNVQAPTMSDLEHTGKSEEKSSVLYADDVDASETILKLDNHGLPLRPQPSGMVKCCVTFSGDNIKD